MWLLSFGYIFCAHDLLTIRSVSHSPSRLVQILKTFMFVVACSFLRSGSLFRDRITWALESRNFYARWLLLRPKRFRANTVGIGVPFLRGHRIFHNICWTLITVSFTFFSPWTYSSGAPRSLSRACCRQFCLGCRSASFFSFTIREGAFVFLIPTHL